VINNNTYPCIIGGDFNIIRFSSEKNKGGIHRHTHIFNSVIISSGLTDLQMTGGKYTWSNNQDPPTLERLDMFLVSKGWESIFPLSMVYKTPRELSGHNPAILTVDAGQPLKN
jgi:exonuclease III